MILLMAQAGTTTNEINRLKCRPPLKLELQFLQLAPRDISESVYDILTKCNVSRTSLLLRLLYVIIH